MKKIEIIKTSLAGSLLLAVFVISGCKKETPIKPVATVTVENVDSANYFKGYFDGEPVKYEGNAYAFHSFIDPDSVNQSQSEHDHDAYYQSGSKWVTLSGTGLQITNASVELRSLAVRVFVSPIVSVSTTYYNLLGPATYPVANDDQSSSGAYVTIRDKNGVLWTSHGDQDGSTLLILSRGANMATYTVVTGTISCKMYDGEGNMKHLTGAAFTAALGI